MSERSAWALGCQVMPWLQHRGIAVLDFAAARAELPDIVNRIGALGFVGFEASLPALDNPSELRDLCARTGVRLAAAHSGGPWWHPLRASGRMAEILAQLPLLRELDCERLVVSLFPRPESPATAELTRTAVQFLSQLGRRCREEAGVRLLFHNHPWEMAADATFITALLDGCPVEDLGLAPDLGWVAIGGMAPETFITRFGSRIEYLHARGVTEIGAHGRTLEAGQGILDYSRIADALEAATFDGWVVAESEYRPPGPGIATPTPQQGYTWTASAVPSAVRSAKARSSRLRCEEPGHRNHRNSVLPNPHSR